MSNSIVADPLEPERGANYIDLAVPESDLGIPTNGELSSGGLWQRQLLNPTQIDLGDFQA